MDDIDDMTPGPHNMSVIWDNRHHVTEDIWNGNDRGELETYCGNRHMRDWKLRRPQRELLHMVGFGIFANPHVVLQTDQRRISALIERWRSETNTFFMKIGEMTVTLEDVGYITGLPVFGEALTCGAIEHRKKFFAENWFEPLTVEEVEVACRRNQIKLSWLFEKYGRRKPEKGNARAIVVATQAYMLFICGAVLFPTSSRSYVHPRYIQPLQNIREIANYAWGAGVLAYLYRGLEYAVKKDSHSVAGCVWLLEVWSYERFPRISVPVRDPEQDDYPVAEGWAYSRKQMGINKKRRVSGPHHSLPFYRAEFDGVAGEVVEWLPYSRFEDMVDWEMIQYQLAGRARTSLVCYDVVEWQQSDRVLRQFGCPPHIPRAPVDMIRYRAPKEATFVCDDWLVRWFVDIGRWKRFCDEFEGLVDITDPVTDAEYMAWYSEITRSRVGRPEPVVQPEYASRELYPNMEGYRVMLAGLEMVKRLDARVPASFVEEFTDIAEGFLTPFTRLMKKIKGQGYTLPQFEHLKIHEEEDGGAQVRSIPEQDIIDMTQPTQHTSQPPDIVSSSSRPPKLTSRRMREDKWDIMKPLSMEKMGIIYQNWGWGFGGKVQFEGGIQCCRIVICELSMKSLAPGLWIDDRIIYAYMALLRHREQDIADGGVWERKPVYYFMDPYFIVQGMKHMKDIQRSQTLGDTAHKKAWDKAQRVFAGFATASVGPSVIEADYIFIPCCVKDVHWVLFVFDMKSFQAIILDSMNDSPSYKKETEVVTWLLPRLIEKLNPNHGVEYDSVPCFPMNERPTQMNCDDCGVFVMKFMDCMLQGIDITTLGSWSQQTIDNFRYRIASEIEKGKARLISGARMRKRIEDHIDV